MNPISQVLDEVADDLEERGEAELEEEVDLVNAAVQMLTTSEQSPAQKKYQEFFQGKLEEWDAKSPADIDDKDKKEFFDEVKKEWKKEK